MADPTLRPWQMQIGHGGRHVKIYPAGQNHSPIASLHWAKDREFEARKANARLIVTAVNCHDELVSLALSILSPTFEHGLTTHSEWLKQCKDKAAEVIAKVREQEQS